MNMKRFAKMLRAPAGTICALMLAACSQMELTIDGELPSTSQVAPLALDLSAGRSRLYPTNWTPAYRYNSGDPALFLHDFSYAGYHEGNDPIPTSPTWASRIFDVTDFGASPDGENGSDDTVEIQNALNAAASNGGGTVYLPAGTYRVSPQGTNRYALWLKSSQTILKGAGSGSTKIFNASPIMNDADGSKAVIRVGSVAVTGPWDAWWYGPETNTKKITQDVGNQASTIQVESTSGLSLNQWVVVRADGNANFIADHNMTGTWDKANFDGKNVIGGPVFYRRIKALNTSTNTITLDIPLRYRMLLRWNPRIYQVPSHIGEVGVQGLSIGMKQNDTGGTGDEDYDNPGTGAYQMAGSSALLFNRVVYGWAKDVRSYRPTANATKDVHLLSKGIEMYQTRNVQIEGCYMGKPQYKGGGGNGYLFQLGGQESLITNSTAEYGRHNFTIDRMHASGNVIHKSRASNARLPSDFHRYLSMSNLFDSVSFDGDYLQAVNRGSASLYAGHTTSQSVFWNVTSVSKHPESNYLVETAQHGYGYVVGTKGPSSGVTTSAVHFTSGSNPQPTDWVEGVGQGANLVPQSLYDDQRSKNTH